MDPGDRDAFLARPLLHQVRQHTRGRRLRCTGPPGLHRVPARISCATHRRVRVLNLSSASFLPAHQRVGRAVLRRVPHDGGTGYLPRHPLFLRVGQCLDHRLGRPANLARRGPPTQPGHRVRRSASDEPLHVRIRVQRAVAGRVGERGPRRGDRDSSLRARSSDRPCGADRAPRRGAADQIHGPGRGAHHHILRGVASRVVRGTRPWPSPGCICRGGGRCRADCGLVLSAQLATLRRPPGLEPRRSRRGDLVDAAGLPHTRLVPELRRSPRPPDLRGLRVVLGRNLLNALGRRSRRRNGAGEYPTRALERRLPTAHLPPRLAGYSHYCGGGDPSLAKQFRGRFHSPTTRIEHAHLGPFRPRLLPALD